jgi:hypothetical protein
VESLIPIDALARERVASALPRERGAIDGRPALSQKMMFVCVAVAIVVVFATFALLLSLD